MKALTKIQKTLLTASSVVITFVKKDGSIRTANVTKKAIPAEHTPKGGKSKAIGYVNFFDLSQNHWISVKPENIKKVVTPPTPSQIKRKKAAAERWQLVKRITNLYHFTVGEALKIASGKTVDGCNLKNLDLN